MSAGASTITDLLPPPLWGRAGERGKPHNEVSGTCRFPGKSPRSFFLAIDVAAAQVAPLSLTLPHKGGGDMPANGAQQCP
jgi:hypothetical protein